MMKKFFFLMFVLFVPLVSMQAQDKLSPELLSKLYKISDPQVSPDGQWVLFRAGYSDVEANKNRGAVYLLQLSTNSYKLLTSFEENAFGARWRPDGKKIGFMKYINGASQLFEMDLNGKNVSQVTNLKDGASDVLYAPDGKHILFTQSVQVDPTIQQRYPNLPLDKCDALVFDALNYRHWDQWNTGAYTHVFYMPYNNGAVSGNPVDIMAGEPYDAPVKPFGGNEQLAWSPDGTKILYTSKKQSGTEYVYSTNSDLYLYDLVTRSTKNITEDNKGYDNDPIFSPDGSKIIYHSMKTPGYESDKNRLFLYEVASGAKKDLTEGFDQSVGNASWSADGNTIYFVSGVQGTRQIYAYDLKAKKGKNPISQITTGWFDYLNVSPALIGKKSVLVASRMDFKTPPTLYTIDLKSKTVNQITQLNAEMLKNVKMGEVKSRWVTAKDGQKIFTWVLYPPNFDSTKKYPALLYAQGGPQSAVDQFFSTRWNLALMACNGYIVVAPNRRGLPGFGSNWNDTIRGDYGGMPMQDLLSAIDDVSKEKYVDKNKLGAVGASFGGYSIFWLAGHHNKRFKCLIAHDGMFNMVSWYGSTEEMFFAKHDQNGSYWDNTQNYERFSPHHFVKNWDAPILIIHGEKDFRVPVTQGIEAFTAAQERGIPSRFLYFPDENHWVLKPQNGVLWQTVFFEWLDTYLKK